MSGGCEPLTAAETLVVSERLEARLADEGGLALSCAG